MLTAQVDCEAAMSSFVARCERILMPMAGTLGQQPHLNAIRDGVVGALPLVLIGSLFMLAAQPPVGPETMAKYYAVMVNGKPLVPTLLTTFRILVGLIGIFVAFGVSQSLARRYQLDTLSAGLLAVAALLLINGIQTLQMITPLGLEQLPKGIAPVMPEGMAQYVQSGRFIGFSNLGSGGLFLAIILGLLVPEVQRLARKFKLEITMPAGVPPAVGRSFSALIPGLIIIVPLWTLVHLFGVDLFAVVNNVIAEPIAAMSKPGAAGFMVMLVIVLIDSVLWLFGVHAVAILAPMAAIWLANITMNGEQGTHYLNTREAFQFYIWLGGSGVTIVLPYLMLRARSVSLRAIAKVSAVPALFNINEPLIFGVPVMMNATLAIPFLLAPIVTLTTTVLATSSGLVPVPSLVVPWTLPGPIGAFLATQGSYAAATLSLVNIALAALIYWPFVRALDRRMAREEEAETNCS